MRIATALVLAFGVAVPAGAQTVRVTIDPATAADIAREVSQLVESSVAAAGVRPQARTFKAEQTDRETRTLAIGSAGALDLDTRSGDITVTAGNGHDATLEIIRRARGRTDADAKLGLDRVKVTVDQRPDRARVRVVSPDDRSNVYSVDVSYIVTAPAGTHMTAATISGTITIKGLRGDVEANVTSGRIDVAASRVSLAKTVSGPVTLTDVETDGSLDVRTVSGTVTLQNVKARRLTADVVASGDVTARNVTCDTAVLKTLSGTLDYSGPLAKNGRYELTAFSGTVRFMPAGTVGFELQASTFSGNIRPDPAMTFHDISLARRSFQGTFGDGSAVVTLKTFSGNVTVGKAQ